MTSLHMLIFCVIFIAHFPPCESVVDVEYKDKMVSTHKGDMFAGSLSTSDSKIVIGAPWARGMGGSVFVHDIVQHTPFLIQESHEIPPPRGVSFGYVLSINQRFIVVGGRRPFGEVYNPTVYVYDTNSPFDLKATFRLDDPLFDVAISDDNTVVVSVWPNVIITYVYDGECEWHAGDQMRLNDRGTELALSGTHLAVGSTHAFDYRGLVDVYNYIGGRWIKQQSIQEQDVSFFGDSVTLYGNHMAVVSFVEGEGAVVFTYEFNTNKKVWINNGRFNLPGGIPDVSIHEDILVATVTDRNSPDACAFAYKLSRTELSTNRSAVLYKWNQMARLTTKADHITQRGQSNSGVRVQQPFVFIARPGPSHGSAARNGIGKVFVYDLSNI